MFLLSVVGTLSSLLKTSLKLGPQIDDFVFRLHYRFTTTVLFVASLLVTATEYFGSSITCEGTKDTPANVLNTYCWIHSTFSIKKHFGDDVVAGKHVPAMGVGMHTKDDETVTHLYYQWVPFFLFFLGITFYIPHYFWKYMEGRRLKTVLDGLTSPFFNEESMDEKLQVLAKYTHRTLKTRVNSLYLWKYVFAEVLNLLNVILSLVLINIFLGGQFSAYGWDLFSKPSSLEEIFPRVAACTYRSYGTSGGKDKEAPLCVLPLNIMNDKVFIFLWVWLIVLSIITILNIFLRVATLGSVRSRSVILRTQGLRVSDNDIMKIVKKAPYGDYYFLYLLGKNMDTVVYNRFLEYLSARLSQ